MGRLWRDYSLSIVLFALFVLSWVAQTWTGWVQFQSEQQQHQAAAEMFGQDGYVWAWAQATFENWQSEFLQLLTFVVLTTYLIHKGSHESKDSDEKVQQALDRIEQRLERLEPASEPALRSTDGGRPNGSMVGRRG
jgi:membrane protein implicated in regulation of membrane protease activity